MVPSAAAVDATVERQAAVGSAAPGMVQAAPVVAEMEMEMEGEVREEAMMEVAMEEVTGWAKAVAMVVTVARAVAMGEAG